MVQNDEKLEMPSDRGCAEGQPQRPDVSQISTRGYFPVGLLFAVRLFAGKESDNVRLFVAI